MKVKLRRALVPSEVHQREVCGICGDRFTVGSVASVTMTDERVDMGYACPNCVEALGDYRPDRFPTIAELEEARLQYPEPVWASVDEAERSEKTEEGDEAYWASWLSRA